MLPPKSRCSSKLQVNFTSQLWTTVSATKLEDLTLALQNATDGFTTIVDQSTDTNIIDIRQLILPVLMKTKYEELTLMHNLYGVIIPTDTYEHIYSKGTYSILTVIAIYDDTIDRDTTRTEVHQAKGKNRAS